MADQRILATENMIGASHPTLSDTLNRLTLVSHENDGTHKFIADSTISTSVSTGAIVTAGGVGIAKQLYVGGAANFAGTVAVGVLTQTGNALLAQASGVVLIGNSVAVSGAKLEVFGDITSTLGIQVKGGAGSDSSAQSAYLSVYDTVNAQGSLLQVNSTGGLTCWFANNGWKKRFTFTKEGVLEVGESISSTAGASLVSPGAYGNITFGTYGNLGVIYSSAATMLGSNVRARIDTNAMQVMNTLSAGASAIRMEQGTAIDFHIYGGSVTAGDTFVNKIASISPKGLAVALPIYSSNTAAKTGGLIDNDLYRSATGEIRIVYT